MVATHSRCQEYQSDSHMSGRLEKSVALRARVTLLQESRQELPGAQPQMACGGR